MAPQASIPVAANVLGTIGTVFWCVQLIPQIWTNWRTKKTDGLPGTMMFLWALCAVPFGAYDIVQNFNIPLQVQPQVFMALCLISWGQTLVYGQDWPAWKAVVLGLVVACVFAGAETALILTLKPMYDRGNSTGILVVGIVAAVLLAVGLLPPYGEIWKRRGRVVGINWIFLCMDWSGAFFSLMALAAQNEFDIMGGVLYILCCLLEIGIFLSHAIWLLRTRQIRAAAAAEGKTFDDVAAEHEAAGLPFKFAERKGGCLTAWRKRRTNGDEKHMDVEAARESKDESNNTSASGSARASARFSGVAGFPDRGEDEKTASRPLSEDNGVVSGGATEKETDVERMV